MSDASSDRLIEALSLLEAVAGELTPDAAADRLDDTALQTFWREWPDVSSWAGALWRRLNQDLARPATPSQEADLDEVGGGD